MSAGNAGSRPQCSQQGHKGTASAVDQQAVGPQPEDTARYSDVEMNKQIICTEGITGSHVTDTKTGRRRKVQKASLTACKGRFVMN